MPKESKKNYSIEEINNPNFYFGTDEFLLPNGDKYKGGYCAHKTGIIWREGHGVYTTKDNHVYEGTWENDQLLDSPETKIKYASGVEFRGSVKKGKYSGEGTYLLPSKLSITCQFEDNLPIGSVIYEDEKNRLWKGVANESDEILLLPENQFYVNMPYERGIGKEKIPLAFMKPKRKETMQKSEEDIDWKELEKEIFAKSTKTRNDFMEDNLENNSLIQK